MIDMSECLRGIIAVVGFGIVGGVCGFSIMVIIKYGLDDLIDFWRWFIKGGWRD